ncbi:MAG: hypothetical protein GY930_10310 [bacterium]|nr:hypothetical protein [bacterium]
MAPAPPKALQVPQGMERQSGLHLGSILSGPQGGERTAEDPVTCRIDVVLLRAAAGEHLEPLAPDLRLVAELGSQSPVQGGSRLAVGARWAHGVDAQAAWSAIQGGEWGDHLAIEPEGALVPMGTTFTLRLFALETIEDSDNFLGEWPRRGPVRKSLAVALFHKGGPDGDGLVAGFALGDLVAAEGEGEMDRVPAEGGRPGGDFLREEWILPSQSPALTGEPLLWLLPSPFKLGPAKTLAVFVRSQAFDAEDLDQAFWDTHEPALTAWVEASGQSGRVEPESEQQARLRQTQRGLRNVEAAREACVAGDADAPDVLRGGLVFLCNLVGLPLGRDLCLTGDDPMLSGWVALLPGEADRNWASADAFGWDLERAAWVCLARSMVKDDLPDAMAALVLRHGGEAGKYPSILEDAARSSVDFDTFERRLEQVNRLFLEDAKPAARVRAFDWLQRRHAAPPNWDPLGPMAERRAVLGPWLVTFESGEGS